MVLREAMRVETVDQWADRPENAERRFEYIQGAAVEVVSTNDNEQNHVRIANDLATGVVVWLVDPDAKCLSSRRHNV